MIHRSRTIPRSLWGMGALVAVCLAAAGFHPPPEHSAFEEKLPHSETIRFGPGSITLTHLNPGISEWLLLKRGKQVFHLQNRNPRNTITLTEKGLRISGADSHLDCPLWNHPSFDLWGLDTDKIHTAFHPLCEGLVYIRLPRPSYSKLSPVEKVTSVLRRYERGEQVINMVKSQLEPLLISWYSETATSKTVKRRDQNLTEGPLPPQTRKGKGREVAAPEHSVGYELINEEGFIRYGHWYRAKMHPGVYLSLYVPALVPKHVLASHKDDVFGITSKEKDKLIYVAAYDLNRYTVRYAVGTKHPPIVGAGAKKGRAAAMKQRLVPIGRVPPHHRSDAVSVFIGGFKERHSTIQKGPHKGKTYGYIEGGVELRAMAPGLATLYQLRDGTVKIGRWPQPWATRRHLRGKVVSARQNGKLLIAGGRPGRWVNDWGEGNWSADVNGFRQSLRAGVCIQSDGKRRHLLFMAFTSATPSAMARVMQAYRCQNGMHLDMNAMMYMHNAIFQFDDKGEAAVEYLHTEMRYPPDVKKHRFIHANYERDFFYVRRRPAP